MGGRHGFDRGSTRPIRSQRSCPNHIRVEASLAVLKKMVRDRGRSLFLVSHREELQGRVSDVLNVIKENGFTTFTQEEESIEAGIELDTVI